MGFRANRTIYKLVFDDPDYEGLIVRIRSGTLAERQEFDEITTNKDLFEFFERMLVEWNAEDDNGAVLPLTAEGIRQLEPTTFREIQSAWIRAVREVAAPLEPPSNDGDPSLEASMPMEGLSESLVS
jgi:hypothetical protein